MLESSGEVVLRLTLRGGERVPTGTLAMDDGEGAADEIEFSGWVELMAALDDLRGS